MLRGALVCRCSPNRRHQQWPVSLWPKEKPTSCKLATVPHCSHPENLVVLSRLPLSCIKLLKSVEQPRFHFVLGCVPVTAIAMFAASFRFSLLFENEIA